MDNTSNPLTLQPCRPLSILTVEDTSDTLAALNARLGCRILHDTTVALLDGYTAGPCWYTDAADVFLVDVEH